MKKKSIKGLLLIAITIIAMTSCSTLEYILMPSEEVESRVENYEKQLVNYQTYDEVMISYKEIIKLPMDHYSPLMNNLKKATNIRLNNIEIEKFIPFYTNLEGNIENVFNEAQSLIIAKAIEKQDIPMLLDWYDNYNNYNPAPAFQDSYTTPGSKVESLVLKAAKAIEKELLKEAIELRDDTIIEKYFEKDPYSRLPQSSLESINLDGWQNAKLKLLSEYNSGIQYLDEKAVYEKAKAEKDPIIYTSQYPNGKFKVSEIPDDKVGRAFSTALDSIENANQFLEDYPDSKYGVQVNIYIIREKWFNSETYLNALTDIPEEMMNSQIMVRDGIIEVGSSFKEFFIDRAPIIDCEVKKSGNDITVIYKGSDDNKFTFTVNMIYSPAYGGMMYVDTIVLRQGFTREVYRTYEEKYSNIIVLYSSYV